MTAGAICEYALPLIAMHIGGDVNLRTRTEASCRLLLELTDDRFKTCSSILIGPYPAAELRAAIHDPRRLTQSSFG